MFKNNLFKKILFVIFCLIAYKIVDNYVFFFSEIGRFLSILSPFFWGIAFAYILNPLMCLFESTLKIPKRVFTLVLVYLIFFGIIVLFAIFIIPVIAENIKELYSKSSYYPSILYSYIENLPNSEYLLKNLGIMNLIENNSSSILQWLFQLSNLTFNSILTQAFNITSGLFNFVLGIFVSIYLLYDKEHLIYYNKKVIRALFPKDTALSILTYFSKVNFYFYNFLIGKLIDSTIIGILCYIGLSLLKIKYALLLSIIVGIFNMIPYFGPFMGAIPSILLTLIYSPVQALWVALFILALQQFDGWYLGPKILGNTVGASPLFIIFSILVGGGFAGALGMLLAVPLFKSLFLLCEEFIDKRSPDKKDLIE
ncbi:MAG: AI-2E family transporter [Peptoanaerobacter stomatis]|uniref:AI-2E family transporter n=1 Tax=Peptoanaerobacter stomatis TaxID=796937 RepID=UPI003F9F74AC